MSDEVSWQFHLFYVIACLMILMIKSKKTTKFINDGYRRHSCTSKIAKIHHFVMPVAFLWCYDFMAAGRNLHSIIVVIVCLLLSLLLIGNPNSFTNR